MQKKIRYIRQRDRDSCGPVAVLNILKWLGCQISYKEYISTVKYLCLHESGVDGGTYTEGMRNALKCLNIKHVRKKFKSLNQIDNHLDKGGVVLFDYQVSCRLKSGVIKEEWHYSLCIGKTKKSYIIVNDGTKQTIGKRLRKTVDRMLDKNNSDSAVWLIKR